MSLSQIWGDFVLGEHHRENPHNPDRSGYHLFYQRLIPCSNGVIPATIRIYQVLSEPAIPCGTIVLVHGRFIYRNDIGFEIEAFHIFPYPSFPLPDTQTTDLFRSRISMIGHVLRGPTRSMTGTVLFPINSVAYVRDFLQVSTVIASIVPNNRWPGGVPSPKVNSPIHVSGPIDCIDDNTKLPVITVEELILEVGNHKLGELAYEAMFQLAAQGMSNSQSM
ncbi:hypothetical protein M422DRAFT_56576 [Sphaerobolus stellatus SS14]|uniref:Uncharacterized protein n=1 Tax=Sphaerobolus stellatus (strain SS14) TaxID=990650 RepID=A0A0C9TQ28_SPHS4|nr:hypothetical protein M422DRAFT_56576 [Sphaerobolus stellatus SS14]